MRFLSIKISQVICRKREPARSFKSVLLLQCTVTRGSVGLCMLCSCCSLYATVRLRKLWKGKCKMINLSIILSYKGDSCHRFTSRKSLQQFDLQFPVRYSTRSKIRATRKTRHSCFSAPLWGLTFELWCLDRRFSTKLLLRNHVQFI